MPRSEEENLVNLLAMLISFNVVGRGGGKKAVSLTAAEVLFSFADDSRSLRCFSSLLNGGAALNLDKSGTMS